MTPEYTFFSSCHISARWPSRSSLAMCALALGCDAWPSLFKNFTLAQSILLCFPILRISWLCAGYHACRARNSPDLVGTHLQLHYRHARRRPIRAGAQQEQQRFPRHNVEGTVQRLPIQTFTTREELLQLPAAELKVWSSSACRCLHCNPISEAFHSLNAELHVMLLGPVHLQSRSWWRR
jgi:hypothetical protein